MTAGGPDADAPASVGKSGKGDTLGGPLGDVVDEIIDETISGVVLAGGLSRRMGGGDKGLLGLGKSTMLGEVIMRFAPQVRYLVINANGDAARFGAFSLPVQADPIEGHVGPLAGILAGLVWSQANCPRVTHVASVSSDAPFLPVDLVTRLQAALVDAPDAKIAMARSDDGLHPVIGLWPVELVDDLHAALNDGVRKVLHWTGRHGTVEVQFPNRRVGDRMIDPFFNANTPDDLKFAREVLAARDHDEPSATSRPQ